MTLNDHMARWFKGDADAVDFAAQLWTASQVWDDLQDEGDKTHIDDLMAWLAFGKELHPFFKRNADVLRPIMLSAYLQWQASNVLEQGEGDDIAKAYMLRACIYQVWHAMAWCVGGNEWAREVGPEIYRQYGEKLADFFLERRAS